MLKAFVCAATVCLAALPAAGQRKITVLPLKDRTGSGARMNISEKAADAILSKLAETGQFIVVEREGLAATQSEKNLKFDADFNPANAPKSGLLAVCDFLVTGQIDEFSANSEAVEHGNYVSKKTEVDGSTALKLSLRVTSVQTGQIIAAPTARVEKTAVLAKSSSSTLLENVGTKKNTSNTDAALLKLVDAEIEDIATELAGKISKGALASGSGPNVGGTAVPAVTPKFVGMENGSVVINKGSSSGIVIGQMFDIVHLQQTDMIDPDTNKPVVRHQKVCTLTVSSVDETTAEGKCPGGTPQKGDELRAVAK
jgi:curli biogenesis system outer membrane secretion channel CsgG